MPDTLATLVTFLARGPVLVLIETLVSWTLIAVDPTCEKHPQPSGWGRFCLLRIARDDRDDREAAFSSEPRGAERSEELVDVLGIHAEDLRAIAVGAACRRSVSCGRLRFGSSQWLSRRQQVVLSGHDQRPQLVEQGEFGVGFVAVAERMFADPVAVALFDVGVVVVLVGPAAGDRASLFTWAYREGLLPRP